MNVLAAILDGAERGSTRNRWLQYQSELAESGITVDNVIISSNGRNLTNVKSVLELLYKAPKYDTLFIQKLLPPEPITRALTHRARRVVYDIDDALYAKPEWGGRLNPMLERSDVIIASSPQIEEYASDYCDEIHVITTAIPKPHYQQYRTPNNHNPVRIGWIGYPENIKYLQRIEDVLYGVLNDYDARLRVITDLKWFDTMPPIQHEAVDYIQWQPEKATRDLGECDLSIRPMSDDAWTRAKSFTSVVEPMALGLPVVVSPISRLNDWIKDGKHGYKVDSADEWNASIRRLVTNADHRKMLGENAKARVGELGLWKEDTYAGLLEVIRQ